MNRMPAKSFMDLMVWQKAHEFFLFIYHFSDHFPKKEIFGLTYQLRRSAVSIAANIAEGFKKRGNPGKIRFMNIIQGSLEESRYDLILANDLHYAENKPLMDKLEEVSKLLEACRTVINPCKPSEF